MAWVKAKPGESFEALLKRFKKAVERSGVLADLRKNEYYEKPSVKRKRKQEAARKRALKDRKKLERQAARKGSNKNFKWNKDRTEKIPLYGKKPANTAGGNRPGGFKPRSPSSGTPRPNRTGGRPTGNRPNTNNNNKGNNRQRSHPRGNQPPRNTKKEDRK